MNKYIKISYFIGLVLLPFFLFACQKPYTKTKVEFPFQSDILKGVLVLPKKQHVKHKEMPLVIFVHGDGVLDRAAYGYYKPIWKELAKNGIACMSWDKKGVGQSTGNWLHQSMKDRALETIAAIQYAKSDLGFENSAIGLIGFSQAGWVIPKVSSLSNFPDFMVIVSPAINWKKQSNYLTKKRLNKKGADSKTIEMEIKRNETSFMLFDSTFSYSKYLTLQDSLCKVHNPITCPKIDEQRYYFIQKNIDSDASSDIQNITCPLLVTFGTEDLNVDYKASYDAYKSILSKKKHHSFQLKIFEDATHGLLKAKHFNYANPGLLFLIKFRLFKKNSFAENFLDIVNSFILENVEP